MPNLCTNHLSVSGDTVSIKRFLNAITTKEHRQDHEDFRILDNLLPSPKNNEDWYNWNIKNYGSKWSDYDGIIQSQSVNELRLVFNSAWSPICEGIRQVSVQFPSLNFLHTFEEGGMQFCGGVAISNGQVLGEVEGSYPSMTSEQLENDKYEEFYEIVQMEVDRIEKLLVELFSYHNQKKVTA